MATVEIRFRVRRTKGFGGTQWQGEIDIPEDLAIPRRRMVARGRPAADQLQALLNAADFTERIVSQVPDDVIPTRAIRDMRDRVQAAADDGGGSSPKDKLKKAGKGLLKVGKKIFGGLF